MARNMVYRLVTFGFGTLALAAFAVALFLIPVGQFDGENERQERIVDTTGTAQAGGARSSAPATERPNALARPVEARGVVEQVHGSTVTIRTAAHDERQIVLRPTTQVLRTIDPAVVTVGDAVAVYTETIASDVYHPPADTRRVRRIDILVGRLSLEPVSGCPTVAIHTGIVTTNEGGTLGVRTHCGEAQFETSPGVQVQRVMPAGASDLTLGVQVTVSGTSPTGGMLDAVQVVIVDPD